jgi:hypothetical protein
MQPRNLLIRHLHALTDGHGRDPGSFPNALATMWFYISDDRSEAESILRDRVVPTIPHRQAQDAPIHLSWDASTLRGRSKPRLQGGTNASRVFLGCSGLKGA